MNKEKIEIYSWGYSSAVHHLSGIWVLNPAPQKIKEKSQPISKNN
jgi:hypothetical protein